jgi:hypothetical protein
VVIFLRGRSEKFVCKPFIQFRSTLNDHPVLFRIEYCFKNIVNCYYSYLVYEGADKSLAL